MTDTPISTSTLSARRNPVAGLLALLLSLLDRLAAGGWIGA
jgi:hypothetical protein